MRRGIDVVELGGRGGVFQHALAVVLALQNNVQIRLMTASDAEIKPSGVEMVSIFSWQRGMRFRSARIVLGFLLGTLSRLLLGSAQVVWVQGTFKPALTLLMILVLRLSGREVVFSPHNLFSRSGNATEEWLIKACVRVASRCVLYNSIDLETLRRRGVSVISLPLLQYVPEIDASTQQEWAALATPDKVNVLFAGQIRRDKNLDLALGACAKVNARLIVLGADTDGVVSALRSTAPDDLDAYWRIGYVELSELCAAIGSVDVVLCPYSAASQSGVAVLARTIGTPVIGTRIAGLGAQADVIIEQLSVDGIADALNLADKSISFEPRFEDQTAYVRAIDELL